jgi:hypothetical protein
MDKKLSFLTLLLLVQLTELSGEDQEISQKKEKDKDEVDLESIRMKREILVH